jgi:hypothetical protein
MSKAILQVNYRFTSSRNQHVEMVTPLAEPLSMVPGLIWKIWLMNEADSEAGGIYLFQNREAANAFMNSQAIADFIAQPSIASVSAKFFEPDEALSLVTRGPLEVRQPA